MPAAGPLVTAATMSWSRFSPGRKHNEETCSWWKLMVILMLQWITDSYHGIMMFSRLKSLECFKNVLDCFRMF